MSNTRTDGTRTPAPTGLERLPEKLTDFLARVRTNGEIAYVSGPGAQWLGRTEAAFPRGASLFASVFDDDHALLDEALRGAQTEGRQDLCLRLLHADGRMLPAFARVLTLSRPVHGAELLFAAWALNPDQLAVPPPDATSRQDPLTGLDNRLGFQQRLTEAIKGETARGGRFVVMHLDLDEFRKVNEALGHASGDQLLAETGRRLKAALRSGDILSRTGGDEFMLALPGTHDPDAVTLVARKLLNTLARPYALGGINLHISSSIGIALFPDHGDDADTLLKHADIALYKAKSAGRNRWHMYQPEGEVVVERRLKLETLMYEAVQNGEFELHYQPLFRAGDRGMTGVEALMRWRRPNLDFITPTEFIPLAEENGLIHFLGKWALRAACHQVSRWNEMWHGRLSVSVNISPLQFRQEDFVASVWTALAESGLASDRLCLEITEGVLMHDPLATEALLTTLRERGVSVSVDDFGTGYSSLAYLKRFPLSTLKIDQSFVRDLNGNPNDQAIVSAILSLGKELGLGVVAEGVEHENQLEFLHAKGCELIQGYLLGRPLPAEAVEDKVEKGEWRLTV